mmetsp:Transcript_13009/g.27506  ORF Transcript_13009/g.27506 Transcript_13009/m.27506 type:complete len:83 (+) Transcript_13009:1234-1482(+)
MFLVGLKGDLEFASPAAALSVEVDVIGEPVSPKYSVRRSIEYAAAESSRSEVEVAWLDGDGLSRRGRPIKFEAVRQGINRSE